MAAIEPERKFKYRCVVCQHYIPKASVARHADGEDYGICSDHGLVMVYAE